MATTDQPIAKGQEPIAAATALPWTPSVSPWLIAATVMLATFMEVLDTSIANVSLPHIAGSLSATVDESTWVLTSYLISNAIVLPLTGWLSMLFGRKRLFIGCVIIFTVSSFLCGLAPNLPLLIFFRILQGAGGGGLQPISQAILVESFSRKKQGMAMAVYGMGVVVAPIIGPTLGGWITDSFSWRWIFFINVPVGVVAILMTLALVEDPPYLIRRTLAQGLKIDFIGLGLLGLGLGFLQVMLDKGQIEDWFESRFIVTCAVLGALGIIGVIFWELNQKEPLIDLRLFKQVNYSMATFMMFALGVVMYGTTVLLPILLQTQMGYTAEWAGLVLSPGGVTTLLVMPLVGRLLTSYQPRWLVVAGLVILAVGMYRLSALSLQAGFWTFVFTWTISRAGMPFLFVPINVMAFAYVPREKTNNATGLINLMRNMGGSVGISLVTATQTRMAQISQSNLASHMTSMNPLFAARVKSMTGAMVAAGSDPVQAAHQAQAMMYGQLLRQSSMISYINVFRVLAWICVALIPLMFVMKPSKPRAGGGGAVH
ncbi:MAG TPA: DHA2 family efflux MFS transporter permease subunit [Bryobacteraceae bacterium]|nr:DHA2 family efflux MFS transporter permease subunit [Bryobacteraceae bacterium]